MAQELVTGGLGAIYLDDLKLSCILPLPRRGNVIPLQGRGRGTAESWLFHIAPRSPRRIYVSWPAQNDPRLFTRQPAALGNVMKRTTSVRLLFLGLLTWPKVLGILRNAILPGGRILTV